MGLLGPSGISPILGSISEAHVRYEKIILRCLNRDLHPDKSFDVVGDSLNALIGKWSEEESKAFLESIAPLEQIDRSFWK